MGMPGVERQLIVKTGCCNRLMKEVCSYEQELQQQKATIAKYKEEGRDPYDIKQQENALQETEQVLPDSIRRLEGALELLQDLVEDSEDKYDCTAAKEVIAETEEFLKARKVD